MKMYINNAWENYSSLLIRRQAKDVTGLEKVCIDEENSCVGCNACWKERGVQRHFDRSTTIPAS